MKINQAGNYHRLEQDATTVLLSYLILQEGNPKD